MGFKITTYFRVKTTLGIQVINVYPYIHLFLIFFNNKNDNNVHMINVSYIKKNCIYVF